MVIGLEARHPRAMLMLVVGAGLVGFSVWGMTRPDLFDRLTLPIMALVAGLLFMGVAQALRSVGRGVDALELADGCLTLREGERATVVGLQAFARVHVVEEPLGRGHPLLCLSTPRGSVIEVSLLRDSHLEVVARALREDLGDGRLVLPELPADAPLHIDCGEMRVGAFSIALSEVTAVDVVQEASVLGRGLVVHRQPVEPLGERVLAATWLRRVAAGEHVPVHAAWGTAVLMALHIDRARAAL